MLDLMAESEAAELARDENKNEMIQPKSGDKT